MLGFILFAVCYASIIPVILWSQVEYNPANAYDFNSSIVVYENQWLEYKLISANSVVYESPMTGCVSLDIPATVSYSMNQGWSRNIGLEMADSWKWFRSKLKATVSADLGHSFGVALSIECVIAPGGRVQVVVVQELVDYEYLVLFVRNGWSRVGKLALPGRRYLECRDYCQ